MSSNGDGTPNSISNQNLSRSRNHGFFSIESLLGQSNGTMNKAKESHNAAFKDCAPSPSEDEDGIDEEDEDEEDDEASIQVDGHDSDPNKLFQVGIDHLPNQPVPIRPTPRNQMSSDPSEDTDPLSALTPLSPSLTSSHLLYSQWLASRSSSAFFGLHGKIFSFVVQFAFFELFGWAITNLALSSLISL